MKEKKDMELEENGKTDYNTLGLDDNLQKSILVRLRRIEGQVKGIEKMVSSEACCKDILVQVAAVRSALNKVGGLLLENYSRNCLLSGYDKITDEKLQQLVSTFLMFLK